MAQYENLIFLISQPRAGSTMLQRVLGGHPDIFTLPEPWVMLYPLYGLRENGVLAEYDDSIRLQAVNIFLKSISNNTASDTLYYQGVRRMYGPLYQQALESSGKQYFLDKTPRYYHIIKELYYTFPEAKYIILLRNPLAVLISMLKAWVKEDWLIFYRLKHDLVRAPQLLVEGLELLGDQGVKVHYEQLVDDPAREVKRICDGVEIVFVSELIEYGRHSLPHWRLGDQNRVYQHTQPTSINLEGWERALDEPQVWRLAADYLQLLGPKMVEKLGYPYEELRQVIETHRPQRIRLLLTFSLVWLLKKPAEERKWWERVVVRITRSLQRRGMRGTVTAGVRRLVCALSNIGSTPVPSTGHESSQDETNEN